MQASKCPNCPSTIFEVPPPQKISGYAFLLNFIQCAKCGAVVGVMPERDAGVLAQQNKESLADVQQRLMRIEAFVAAAR